jgi:hypothetical protein
VDESSSEKPGGGGQNEESVEEVDMSSGVDPRIIVAESSSFKG